MNVFELCTKRSPRRLGVHAWEKYLTADEFQDLSACRDEAERVAVQLEDDFSPDLVQVYIFIFNWSIFQPLTVPRFNLRSN
jgi:hypothetical protein